MTEPKRFCPICETPMDDAVCPVDGVPTVLRSEIDEEGQLLAAGTLIANRYRIEGLVARGGMGDVYGAVQTSMNRRVAVKTLLKDLQREPTLLKRFYREAKSASLVDHPNVVRIFDFGVDDETSVPFIAMEFLEGTTLTQVMRAEGPFPEARAASILVGVGRALAAAHAKGLVHRDLKPDNIQVQQLSDGEEHIKVFDFGIAKMQRAAGDTNKSMTEAGVAIGTPQYMSPEQAMGRRVDHRADLYSLGCILYEMVVGQPPFDGPEIMPILVDQAGTPPPLIPPMLPTGRAPSPALVQLYEGLMHKEPEARPSTAKVVTRALRALARGERDVQAFEDLDDSMTVPPRAAEPSMRGPNPMPTAEAASPGPPSGEAATMAHPSVDGSAGPIIPAPRGHSTVAGLTPETPPPAAWDASMAPTMAAPSVESPGVGSMNTSPSPVPSMHREPTPTPTPTPTPIPTPPASSSMVADTHVDADRGESGGDAATAEALARQKAKTPLLVAAVLLLGSGIAFLASGDKAESTAVQAPSTTAAPAVPAPKAPATASVTVNSTPAGADIFRGEDRLGTTPYTLAFPKTEFPVDVTLRKTGFDTTGTTLRADLGAVTVHLSPTAVAPPPATPSAVAPSPSEAKATPVKKPPTAAAVNAKSPKRAAKKTGTQARPKAKARSQKKTLPKKAATQKSAPKKTEPPPKTDVEVEAW